MAPTSIPIGTGTVDFTKTLSSTFTTYRAGFGRFLAIGAAVALVTFVATTVYLVVYFQWLAGLIGRVSVNPSAADLAGLPGLTAIATAVLMLPVMLVAWWGALALCVLADGVLTGQPVTVREAVRQGWSRLVSLLPIVVIAAVVTGLLLWWFMVWVVSWVDKLAASPDSAALHMLGVGAIITVVCLVLGVVGYILAVRWYVAFPVMVSEKKSILPALGRSWRMTKGSALMIFLLILVVGMAVGIVTSIPSVPGSLVMVSMSVGVDTSAGASALMGRLTWATIAMMAVTFVITAFITPVTAIMSQVVYRTRLAAVPVA